MIICVYHLTMNVRHVTSTACFCYLQVANGVPLHATFTSMGSIYSASLARLQLRSLHTADDSRVCAGGFLDANPAYEGS